MHNPYPTADLHTRAIQVHGPTRKMMIFGKVTMTHDHRLHTSNQKGFFHGALVEIDDTCAVYRSENYPTFTLAISRAAYDKLTAAIQTEAAP